MGTRLVEIIATLTDNQGNPLSNKPIYLYYRESGTQEWKDIGSNPHTTDSDGKASAKIELSAPATYDFKAEFKGDEDYEPSSAEKDNVHIKCKTKIELSVKQL